MRVTRWRYYVTGGTILLALLGAVWFVAATATSRDPLARVAAMQPGLAAVRHLALEHPVPAEYQATAEFRKFVHKNVNADEARHRAEALTALGLLPPGTDLGHAIEDAHVTQAAAYYDPAAKKFFIVMRPETDTALDVLAAHELTHGLQDQHFDLRRYLDQPGLDADAFTARRFVVEGDAMVASMMYLVFQQTLVRDLTPAQLDTIRDRLDRLASSDLKTMVAILKAQAKVTKTMDADTRRSLDAMDKIPPTILVPLIQAYFQGALVVLAAYRHGGWAAVDQLYRDPPASTAQVLHPEERLLARRDLPHRIALPAFEGYEPVDSDVLGELQWSVYFSLWKHDGEGHAEQNWDGDRYAVLRGKDGKLLVLIATIWDSKADAKRFYDAYMSTIRTRYPDGGPAKPGAGSPDIVVRRVQDRVYMIAGGSHELMDTLVAHTTFDPPLDPAPAAAP